MMHGNFWKAIVWFSPTPSCGPESAYSRIKTLRKTILILLLLTTLSGSLFDSSEKKALRQKRLVNLQRSTHRAICT